MLVLRAGDVCCPSMLPGVERSVHKNLLTRSGTGLEGVAVVM